MMFDHIRLNLKRMKRTKTGDQGQKSTDRYDVNPTDNGATVKVVIDQRGNYLAFDYTESGIVRTYSLNADECTMSTWKPNLIQADLVLVPLLRLSKLNPDSAIVHYRSGEEFHLRTAVGQMSKIFFFSKGKFSPFAVPAANKEYIIEITDHQYWSTSF